MTQAEFRYRAGKPDAFSVRGHSGYGSEGTDIVCAAVSSAALMTCNTVTEVLGVQASVLQSQEDVLVQLELPVSGAGEAWQLLEGLRLHLQSLQAQYPRFLRVITKGK